MDKFLTISRKIFTSDLIYNSEIASALSELRKDHFLSHILIKYPESYVYGILIVYYKQLLDVPFSDIKEAFKNVSNYNHGLFTLCGFFSKFLSIDLLVLFNERFLFNISVKADVLNYFSERPGTLRPNLFDIKRVESFNANILYFQDISKRMISEGAFATSFIPLWDLEPF